MSAVSTSHVLGFKHHITAMATLFLSRHLYSLVSSLHDVVVSCSSDEALSDQISAIKGNKKLEILFLLLCAQSML